MSKRISCLVTLLLCVASDKSQAQNVVQNGNFASGTNAWTVPANTQVVSSVVDTQVGHNKQALRLVLSPAADAKPWNIIVRQAVNAPLKKDDVLVLKAWLRSPQSLKTFAFLEAKDEKFTKSLEEELTLSPEWKEYEVRGVAKNAYAAGETSVGFHLGYGAGTVEMTGLQLQAGTGTTVAPAAPASVVTVPAAPAASLQNPITLVPNGNFAAPLTGNWRGAGSNTPQVEVVETNGQKVLRVITQVKEGQNAWDSRLTSEKIPFALERHSLVAVRFRARSKDNVRVGVMFQQADPPHTKTISKTSTLTPDWQEYRFIGKIDPALATNSANFEFHIGYNSGSFELADVRVQSFGVSQLNDVEGVIGAQTIDYWGGQKHDDGWKKAAFERIEKHRKADLNIRVVDAAGKAVPNASVLIAQTRQQFRFGSAVVAGRLTDKENPDNVRYQAEVERLFNSIVFENDLKWDNRNPRKTEQALAALKWLQARNIPARGHTLVWGSRKYLPADVVALWDDTEKLRAAVRTRVREQATAFKGQLYVWDVVNEAATNTELWEKLGWDEFANVFKIAREVDPNVRLAYNDYNISNESQNPPQMQKQRRRVAEIIQMLKEKGAPLDIYGDQAHFGLPLTPPARMVEIWDEVATLGLPIEITEFDAGIPDDKLHGEYVRDALIAAFSHPAVDSFIMWGFWEGAHWRAGEGGAMFRKDWSKRPAQLAYEDLVLNQWRTNLDLKSNADGSIKTRGFLGEYEARVTVNGKSKTVKFKLPREGTQLEITM